MADRTSGQVVAVDSMVLAYAVREKPDRKGGHKVRRAKLLFEQLEEDKAVILISTVVLAEYLKEVPESDRQRTAEEIGAEYQVVPFDLEDTVLATRLWSESKPYRRVNEEGHRNKIKCDAMILATAINKGAGEVFTEDDDFLKMARRHGVDAKRLPDFSVPPGSGLFEPKQ